MGYLFWSRKLIEPRESWAVCVFIPSSPSVFICVFIPSFLSVFTCVYLCVYDIAEALNCVELIPVANR